MTAHAQSPFSTLFPFDRFRELLATLDQDANGPYAQGLETLVKPAFRELLSARRAAGLLRPVPDGAGHASPFIKTAQDTPGTTRSVCLGRYARPSAALDR